MKDTLTSDKTFKNIARIDKSGKRLFLLFGVPLGVILTVLFVKLDEIDAFTTHLLLTISIILLAFSMASRVGYCALGLKELCDLVERLNSEGKDGQKQDRE